MEFDTLIRGGSVVDGSGSTPARVADVGISGERIAAVGDLTGSSAATTIDTTGKIVGPGFIDVHVHSELALLGGPHRYGAVAQGVTTHLLAPDGFGWSPLDQHQARTLGEALRFAYGEGAADCEVAWPTAEAYLARFQGQTPANVVPQVPHCAVRYGVLGWAPRAATDAELDAMRAVTREWLDAGAVCLNLGLDYQPSAFADTRELVALSEVAREYDAIYAAHVRYSDLGIPGAWRETMAIALDAGIPVHISHESITSVTGPLLDEAAARGCDLTFESYLYPAGCTHLALLLPIAEQAGGPAGIRARLADPANHARLRQALGARLAASYAEGARIVFAANQTGRYIGLDLREAAVQTGEPLADFALRILAEEDPYALMVYHRGGTPEEQAAIQRDTIRHPRMLVASDGVYHGPHGHPRGYGCFARVLRYAVREQGWVSLESAIHKMSGYPAERFRLRDRGLLRPGYGADVVIFDVATVTDRATWDEPFVAPTGIDRVLVNGRTVVADGVPTGELPGQVLRPLNGR